MKKILSFTIFIVLLFCGYGNAATIEAASCSLTHVQAAVTEAARGDTVTVPACASTTWADKLYITKAITLQGAGVDATTIKVGDITSIPGTVGECYQGGSKNLIQYRASSVASDASHLLRITGFTFDADQKTGIIILRNTETTYLKARIDNNKFNNLITGETGDWSYHAVLVRGLVNLVIDTNTFNGAPFLEFLGTKRDNKVDGVCDQYGEWNWENEIFTYGDGKGIYIEDNIFNTTNPQNLRLWNSGWGARLTVRYNTINDSATSDTLSGGLNGHNAYGGIFPSALNEMYGNYFNETVTTDWYSRDHFLARGGKNLSFSNRSSVTGKGQKITTAVQNTSKPGWCGTQTTHTCPSGLLTTGTYCTTDGMPQEVSSSYFFRNTYGATGGTEGTVTASNAVDDCESGSPPPALRENIDYWKYNTNCSGTACAAGVGCGTILPQYLGEDRCTTGTAFWLTSQSCSEVSSANIGANPVTPISGTLYRCNTTNHWTEYYTPYTYPHPLRGAASDCSLENIETLIANASPGDTINVPAGQCTWSRTLKINKAVSIIGAGTNGDQVCDAGETCITAGWTATDTDRYLSSNYLLYFWMAVADREASYDKDIRVSGFHFDLDGSVSGIYALNVSTTYPWTKFQFDNNVMLNSPCSSSTNSKRVTMLFYGEIYGVMHNNLFTGSLASIIYGNNQNSYAVTGKKVGSTKALFIEDNTLTKNTACAVNSNVMGTGETGASGGGVVFRYNTGSITYNAGKMLIGPFQNHGNNAYNNTGGLFMEVYGNKFTDPYGNAWFHTNLRGGQNMIFFNQNITSNVGTTYYSGGPYMEVKECEECGTTYPNNGRGADINTPTGQNCPTGDNRLYPTAACIAKTLGTGYNYTDLTYWWGTTSNPTPASESNCYSCSIDGQPQHVWKTYIWNNRNGAGGLNNQIMRVYRISGALAPEKNVVENTHFFRDIQGGTFDGSLTPITDNYTPTLGKPGVGCGLVGDRPPTCSVGAGYWVIPNSTQSCSQVLSTSVGRNPSNKISGYLSTCKAANTWSANTTADINSGYTYVPSEYPHPLRSGGVSDNEPPVAYGVASPTGQQACADVSEDVPVSFQVQDASTVTCRSCKAGTEGCDVDTTYDEMVAMTGETVYTSTQNGTIHTQTATIASACSSSQSHFARCTDSAGNDMTSSIGITYSMEATEDSDDPELVSATMGADGVSLTLVFDEDVQFGTGGGLGSDWTLTRGRDDVETEIALTYTSGVGSSSLVYTTESVILATDDITITYTQPGDGIVDKSGTVVTYVDSCPDSAKYANLAGEVPDGDALGLCNWTKDAVTGSGIMDFTYSCDDDPALGCEDIDTTYCTRQGQTTNTSSTFIAYKLLSDTGLTGNIYIQAYMKLLADAYESDGTTPMTYTHDIELIGINPLGNSGAMSVYLGLTGGYYGSTSHRPSLSLYYMADRDKGGTGPATLIKTDTSYDGTTNTFCEIEGRSTISVDTWIGVRIHIYNSGTADSDTIQFWVDWDNDGNFTDLGKATGVNLQNALKYLYLGNFGFLRKYDVQMTGIKVDSSGMPPACSRIAATNNELASIGATVVTNNSGVSSGTTQTLFDQDVAAPGASAQSTEFFNAGVRFQSSQTGTLTDICFYKHELSTGTHIGTIYNSSGEVLSQVTFSSESESGWQCQALSPTLSILKNTTYTAAVFFPSYWVRTLNFFGAPFSNDGYLTAQANNGSFVFSQVGTPAYPSIQSTSFSNFWVDVEIDYAGVAGPWEIAVTNASATGAKCTIVAPTAPVANTATGEVVVTVAPGWKADFTGTCGGTAVLVDNVYTYTTNAVGADCGVTVTCYGRPVAPWLKE